MNVDGKVLVTGAGGFVGGRVVERFHLEDVAPVVAGVHHLSNCARIGRFDVDVAQVDVLDPEGLREAMADCRYVVHCAFGGREVTVDGTRNVLRAAKSNGVEQVVHLSTAEVYGDRDGVHTEDDPIRHSGSDYADAKVDAERVCREFDGDVGVTVLRPTIVYGPFGEDWTVKAVKQLQSGRWGDVEALDGACSPVYVDDLVSLIGASLGREPAHGEAFNVTGGETVTWNDYFLRLADAVGGPDLESRSLWRIYPWTAATTPVRMVGEYAIENHQHEVRVAVSRSSRFKRLAEFLRETVIETPTFDDLSLYRRQAEYPIAKARETVGYDPAFDLDRGLELTAEWLDHHGYA